MTAVSISHARENLFPLMRQVNEDHVVIEIVARNGGNAVLMSASGQAEPPAAGSASAAARSPPAATPTARVSNRGAGHINPFGPGSSADL